jgi:hypothetical protein
MKAYYAAGYKTKDRFYIIWGIGTTENAARRDAAHYINDRWDVPEKRYWRSATKEDKQKEKKRLKIFPISKEVKAFVNEENGGYKVWLRKCKGIYEIKKL